MKIWLAWIQGDDVTWLEAAMDDDTTAESGGQWESEVARCRKLAFDNNYELRIQAVEVPGVYDLFEIPIVRASEAKS